MCGSNLRVVLHSDCRQWVIADSRRYRRHPGIGCADAALGRVLRSWKVSSVRSPRVEAYADVTGNVEAQDPIRPIGSIGTGWMRVRPDRVLEGIGAVREVGQGRMTVDIVESRPGSGRRARPVPQRDLMRLAVEAHC